jgi:membrane-associated phospholipid phosphatase
VHVPLLVDEYSLGHGILLLTAAILSRETEPMHRLRRFLLVLPVLFAYFAVVDGTTPPAVDQVCAGTGTGGASNTDIDWTQSDKGIRILDNLVTTTPYSIGVASLYVSLVTQDPSGIYVLAIAALTEISNGAVFKPLAKTFFGEAMTRRPNPASNIRFGNHPKGCGIYFEGKASRSSGMPSGHAQGMGTFSTFFTLYMVGKMKRGRAKGSKVGIASYAISLLGLWTIATVVVLHRSPLWSGCHSPAQLTVGALLGAGLGVGFYAACNALDPARFPSAVRIVES